MPTKTAKSLSLFATPLAALVAPNAPDLNAALGPRVQQLFQAAGPVEAALPWQSPPQSLLKDDRALAQIAWMIATLADAMAAPKHWPGPPQSGWDALWFAELLLPGQGLPVHDYPRADWCGCYLIDDGGGSGESGEMELLDPRGAAVMMYAPTLTFDAPGGDVLGISQTVNLTPGSLLVFPAWLHQGTSANRGPRPRLAIKLLLTARHDGGQ
ncbi:MAG: hypothetical protein Kilf2KO_32820 [Rhodospirillales bacterium]